MSHPGRGDLAGHAMGIKGEADETIMLHVQSCADCAFEVRMLREASADLVAAETAPVAGHISSCPDEVALAALADGASSPEQRAALLAHLAECPRCRRTLAAVSAALADPRVRQEVAASRRPRVRRARYLVLPAAAAAILVWVALPSIDDPQQYAHRGTPPTAAVAPVVEWPVGSVASVRELRWAQVERADRYRVTVFNESGAVVYEWQGVAAKLQLPDSVVLQPGRRYLWRVEARTGWDRWAESTLVPFSVTPEPAR